MRAKSHSKLVPTRAILFALACFCCSQISAQQIDFQDAIDSTAEALILLDVKASDCLNALNSDAQAKTLCDDFISAIDGELMASYIDQCRVLKDWRDDYVEQTVSADLASDSEENNEMLRRLIAIEYSCGENTLQNRTEFVVAAFDRLQSNAGISAASTRADAASVRRQLSESRFNALEDRERQRLLDAVQSQQRRSERESERQFNDLENELIRQQIQTSNPPN